MIVLRNIINENQEEELIKIAKSGNGFISPSGKIYSVPQLKHIDFLVKLPEYKDFKDRLKIAKSNPNIYSQIYQIVINDAARNGWIRFATGGTIGILGDKKYIKKRKNIINDIIMFIESGKKRSMNVNWEYIK